MNNNDSGGKFKFLSFAIEKGLAVKIGVALIGIAVVVGLFIANFSKQPEQPEPNLPSGDSVITLPDRSYVIAEVDPAPPQNLNELLNCVDVDAETLLQNDAMVEALLTAESLSDVVDSRLSINNLRAINQQLDDMIAVQPDEVAAAYIEDGATKSEMQELKQSLAASASQSEQAADTSTTEAQPEKTTRMLPVDQLATYNNADGGKSLINLITENKEKQQAESQSLNKKTIAYYSQQHDKAVRVNKAIETLLKPADFSNLVTMPSQINIKTIYDDKKGLIHLIPSGDWLPEDGYKLYRVVNGDRQLIKQQKSYDEIKKNVKDNFDSGEDGIAELFESARLTDKKITELGMTRDQFNDMAYRVPDVEAAGRFSGERDFLNAKQQTLTIAGSLSQKIPQSEKQVFNTVLLSNEFDNSQLLAPNIRMQVLKQYSLEPANQIYGIDELKATQKLEQYQLAEDIMRSRHEIVTLGFVNDDFAEISGFLVKDDLSSLGLNDGDVVEYVIETSSIERTTSDIVYGKVTPLSKPQNLLGYGVDGKVKLRWQRELPEQEEAIISGYFIERRLEGEADFVQINDIPVVVSYILDETNNYFEVPVFYEEELENGKTVEYRIRSLDIFGRMSEYSDAISFKVEKISPPSIPTISKTVYSEASDQAELDNDPAVTQVLNDNSGTAGIAVPIFANSLDTAKFTLYRAVAIGAQGYGAPELLTTIDEIELIDEQQPNGNTSAVNNSSVVTEQLDNSSGVGANILDKNLDKIEKFDNSKGVQPTIVYYDSDIVEGATYKYWVSSWDTWNNESGWSQSSMCMVPTKQAPADTSQLSIAMLAREMPDFSKLPPGIYGDLKVALDSYLNMNIDTETHAPENANTAVYNYADQHGISVGKPYDGMYLPDVISVMFDNLPSENLLHSFVAIPGEDVADNGFSSLKWQPYMGDGLAGYEVYHPISDDATSLAEMQNMTRAELLANYNWKKITTNPVLNNQMMVGGLKNGDGEVNLFLICLKPTEHQDQNLVDLADDGTTQTDQTTSNQTDNAGRQPELHSGSVKLNWLATEDPQVKYYRVYRAEVPSFDSPIDESALDWILIGNNIFDTTYTDPVEQNHAYYYYYKVHSVSAWGVESSVGTVERFRVPSTMPPQMPNLLAPLQRKDGVEVNFSAVPYCNRYVVYRTEIPEVKEEAVSSNSSLDFSKQILEPTSIKDKHLKATLGITSSDDIAQSNTRINPMTRLNTIGFDPKGASSKIANLDNGLKKNVLSGAYSLYGPLGVAEYRDLPYSELMLIEWDIIAELPADHTTAEAVDSATGLLKPLSLMDDTAEYGVKYYYTVQAWNDDNLGSCRPEPVEATPRRSGPFDPITGLVRDGNDNVAMRWNTPTMENLSVQDCIKETVGYVVYRSDTEKGEYLQASPLLFDTAWVDQSADRYANNYYKVKVLDTGGYFSKFSEALLIKDEKVLDMPTFIPTETPDMTAPTVSIRRSKYSGIVRRPVEVKFGLTGTEPIELEATVKDENGVEIDNFLLSKTNKTLTVNKDKEIAEGVYNVTISATNNVGTNSDTCQVEFGKEPRISFAKSNYQQTAGQPLTVPYTLTGSDPIDVAVKMIKLPITITAANNDIAGFNHDANSKQIIVSDQLPAGSYRVNASATNQFGESSAAFELTINGGLIVPTGLQTKTSAEQSFPIETETEKESVPASEPPSSSENSQTATNPPAVAPTVLFVENSHSFKEDQSGVIDFTYSGTQPITLQASYDGAGGSGDLQIVGQQISIVPGMAPGNYVVTLKASNVAGEASAVCKLKIKPAKVKPNVSFNQETFTFKLDNKPIKIPFNLTGTEPITTKAKLIKPVAFGVAGSSAGQSLDLKIDNRQILIPDKVGVGEYEVEIEATNEVGSDTAKCNLIIEETAGKPPITQPKLPPITQPKLPPIQPPKLPPIQPPKLPPNSGPSGKNETMPLYDQFAQINRAVSRSKAVDILSTAPSAANSLTLERVTLNNFILTNLQLQTYASDNTGYFGTATLQLGNYNLAVEVFNATISQNRMTKGVVYIKEYRTIEDANLIIASLNISANDSLSLSTGQKSAKISGYLKRNDEKNILGNIAVIEFKDAHLNADGTIVITHNNSDSISKIRYQDFELIDCSRLIVDLTATDPARSDFIKVIPNEINLRMPLETLSGKGLNLEMTNEIEFDINGQMTANFTVKKLDDAQFLVPGGALLESIQSQISCQSGVRQGDFSGKLILPFENDTTIGAGVPGQYASHTTEYQTGEFIADDSNVDRFVLRLARKVQDDALLIVPEDQALQDQCASVAINLDQWDGKAFKTTGQLTPVRIAERSLDIETQRSQAIILQPTTVKVDLDRNDAFTVADSTSRTELQTPSEIAAPFWVGIIIDGGTLSLPPDFVKTEDGQPIDFELAEGEMIYDLNGFSYQSYLFNEQGTPAEFGDALGGFEDVKVYNCLLDMYNNKVNLEIDAKVKLDMFGDDQWLGAKLYTNKEDNSDGKKGEFICSVAPSLLENAAGQGADLVVNGGHFREEGVYCNGSLALDTAEIQTIDLLEFTDLVIPADIAKTKASHSENSENTYGYVELDKPAVLEFKNFKYEARILRIEAGAEVFTTQYLAGPTKLNANTITISGSTLLAGNIPLGQNSTDVINFIAPRDGSPITVQYEKSHAELAAVFDDCINLKGKLVPKLTSPNETGELEPMEFDGKYLLLNYLGNLDKVDVEIHSRFGYDPRFDRNFFAVGIMQKKNKEGEDKDRSIKFGFGKIDKFTGLVAYNMILEKDERNRFKFPKASDKVKEYINGLKINGEEDRTFGAGIKGTLTIDGLVKIEDLYFGYMEGPIVTANGMLYVPLSTDQMVSKKPDECIGGVTISYSHPQRYFSFIVTVKDIKLADFLVGGSLGFEYSPNVFGLAIGYPETLYANVEIYRFGLGVAFKIAETEQNHIKMKAEFGLEKDVEASIVYLHGNIYAGAEGAYYWGAKPKSNDDDTEEVEEENSDYIMITVYVKGKAIGGIKVKGKKYEIIKLMLDAKGQLKAYTASDKDWELECSVKVSYHLNLYITSYDGSANADFGYKF